MANIWLDIMTRTGWDAELKTGTASVPEVKAGKIDSLLGTVGIKQSRKERQLELQQAMYQVLKDMREKIITYHAIPKSSEMWLESRLPVRQPGHAVWQLRLG